MTEPSHLVARMRWPGSPSHAALLRVMLGTHLLLVLMSPALDLLFAIAPGNHVQAHILGGSRVFALLSVPWVERARVVGIVAGVCTIVGLGGRFATGALLCAFVVTQLYWFGATLFHDDWIFFVFPLLALLSLQAPTAYSLDGWLRRRSIDPQQQIREARFLVEAWVFWIGFLYLAAGIAKLFPLVKGIDWLAGHGPQLFAVEFVRESPAVVLFGTTLFPYDMRWLFSLGAVATVVIELGAAAVWWTRRVYLPLALGIFSMHLSFWLVGIPGFIGMFAILSAAMLPARAFAGADAWHRRFLSRATSPSIA